MENRSVSATRHSFVGNCDRLTSRLSLSNRRGISALSGGHHSYSCDNFVSRPSEGCFSFAEMKSALHSKVRRSISADNKVSLKYKNTTLLDRFIPCRSAMDMEVSSFLMTNKENDICVPGEDGVVDEKTLARRKLLRIEENVLKFRPSSNKPANLVAKTSNHIWASCSADAILLQQAKGKHYRPIPKGPERVLDAPCIRDDFYLKFIDWSYNNIVCLALDNKAYLWNAATHDGSCLYSSGIAGTYISSVAFLPRKDIIAISTSSGYIEIRNYNTSSHVRAVGNQQCRVSALRWNGKILASGSRSGRLQLDDVRLPSSVVAVIPKAHHQEICGMDWSPCGKYLATGGNDNRVHVWDVRKQGSLTCEPLYSLNPQAHSGAVKALAWCPWQHSLLATAGGAACRSIRVTNVNNGDTVAHIKDTRSQITGLIWSDRHRELLSSHGQDKFQMTLWRWPNLVRICELCDHIGRILDVALSPDGRTVVSAGADETLRLWDCFNGGQPAKQSNASLTSIMNGLSTRLTANGNFPFGNVR